MLDVKRQRGGKEAKRQEEEEIETLRRNQDAAKR